MNYKLNPDFTFENFIVGSGNVFAYTACKKVAESPGTLYNPLIICGDVGCGKTHLMHAIGNCYLAKNNDFKIKVLTSDIFVREFIAAIRNSCMDDFRASFNNIDLLLIDSIQFFVDKVHSPEELLHIYDLLMNQGRAQIVFTSDKEPALLNFNDALTSRLSSGLIVKVGKPDRDDRIEILQHYARKHEVELTPDAASLLAEKAAAPRELEGLLTRVRAYAVLRGAVYITIDCVQDVLSSLK